MNKLTFIFTVCLIVSGNQHNWVLEEFDAENDQNMSHAEVNLQIHQLWNNSLIENWQHYQNAFEKLHKAWPNLKNLHLFGGHSYNRQNSTFLQIRCDLLLVHNALDAISSQMKKLGLKAGDSVNYTLFHFIDKKQFNVSGYHRVLDEVFSGNATVDKIPFEFVGELYAVNLKYQLNGIPINLIVHTVNISDDLGLDYGRLDYKSEEWRSVASKLKL